MQADLYDAPAAIPKAAAFDMVFVTWGAIVWLPDIYRWAEIVCHFLKPGGSLYLAEVHPAAMVFDDADSLPDGKPGFFARISRVKPWCWKKPTTTSTRRQRSPTRRPIPGYIRSVTSFQPF